MKRIVLLGGGILAALGVAAVLVIGILNRNGGEELAMPRMLKGTQLELVELRSYSGYFDEDGSGREVSRVAALVVRNHGEKTVSRGVIRLLQKEKWLEFSFTMIPPGGEVLVPERFAASYESNEVGKCLGWVKTADMRYHAEVEAVGRSLLRVHNTSEEDLDSAVFWFKRYDAESGLYIGGVSYSFEVSNLPAGRSTVIPVHRYIWGKCAIVGPCGGCES